jgi:hypothetical protein
LIFSPLRRLPKQQMDDFRNRANRTCATVQEAIAEVFSNAESLSKMRSL